MKVLVTGASGFVGSALVAELLLAGHQVRACSRAGARVPESEAENFIIASIDGSTDWFDALQGVDVIVENLCLFGQAVFQFVNHQASLL